jgi:integrase
MLTLALRRVGTRTMWMRQQGQKTRYPGVYRVNDNSYRVRAVGTDPRTGKKKAVEKLYEGVSAQQAARLRTDLIEEIVAATRVATKQRVSDFARSWIASKAVSVDAATASTYADALEQHVLPVLGDYWYDALMKADVQKWVDDCFSAVWKTPSGTKKRYSRNSVHGWFRVFRTMTRDAVDALHLLRDPCVRIRFPQEELCEESNALEPEELLRFLAEMRARYPHHHAMVTLLAFTGLRFCHASALKWEDWDEDKAVLHVRRKHVRGEVAPVSRKKRAPGVIPVEPELAEVLREHRARLVAAKAPGFAGGWMFPSDAGTLRTPNTMDRAWTKCLDAAKVKRRFTVHGLRYTFTDLIRLSKADAVVRRALTGHVTQEMQQHYSHVGTDEKRAAIAGALRLLANAKAAQLRVTEPAGVNSGVNRGGSEEVMVS